MQKYPFPAVILAGGKSSRMGADKSCLPFGRYSSLSEYQYKKLETIFSDVFISSKEDKFDFLTDKKRLIIDTSSDISSAMVALQSIFQSIKHDYIFIIAVDIPLLKKETIQTLYESFLTSMDDIVIAKDDLGNIHNLCGIFHKNIVPTIHMLLQRNVHKINFLIKHSKYHEVLIEKSDQFLNLNDQVNYEKACRLLKAQPPVK